jgi:putative flippase GtrA
MKLKSRTIFLRFLIAGGVNTLFGWLVYAASILMGAQLWLALIIAIVTGIGFNFVTLGGYAFQDMTMKRFPRFVLSYALIYITNLICLKALEPCLSSPIWGQLILTPPLAIFSYLVLSRIAFNNKMP